MTMLRDELTADPVGIGYDLRDLTQIERVINARTRTRFKPTEVGKGDAINALGLEVGNALCDVIDNEPSFRHVCHLLADGRLRLDYAITQGALQSLVGSVLTAEHVTALNALALEPCSRADELGLSYVTDAMIREALA